VFYMLVDRDISDELKAMRKSLIHLHT